LQQQANGFGEDGFAAFGFAGVVPVGLLLLARPVWFRLFFLLVPFFLEGQCFVARYAGICRRPCSAGYLQLFPSIKRHLKANPAEVLCPDGSSAPAAKREIELFHTHIWLRAGYFTRSAPALAHCASCALVAPETPMAPTIFPSSTRGIPPSIATTPFNVRIRSPSPPAATAS